MNKAVEYEKFVQDVYQSIVDAQGYANITVQHNVKLKGRSNQEHQIDIYWEFELAGVKNRVAIECKNYSTEVPIGKVRDFYGVLTDIGNINGVMVSTVGFQSGAKEFASHYGIDLIEVRVPKSEDWMGRIKSLVLLAKVVMPNIRKGGY
ncbi:MAG: hypothetical protein OJF59_002503 [Cytophagales bacterium]|jgi:predicted helicase|nr:restriction endonuclease [Bacteroidota bacterium]MBS1980229.1 restriction endonuclease [Bacteroidota bacterium]WHZ08749.1 MAG: hypothetical protein OJF59_002503 [Cytophagales bacterium]